MRAAPDLNVLPRGKEKRVRLRRSGCHGARSDAIHHIQPWENSSGCMLAGGHPAFRLATVAFQKVRLRVPSAVAASRHGIDSVKCDVE